MNKLSLVLASLLLSTSVFAANQRDLSCHSSFGSHGPFRGYQLEITKTPTEYVGVLSIICVTCRVVPTMIHFESREFLGTVISYKNNDSVLRVSVESLLPTRSHPATLKTPGLNNGRPVSFTCEN